MGEDHECPSKHGEHPPAEDVRSGRAQVKTVHILSTEGALLGTIRRGCPALLDSFSWTVPQVPRRRRHRYRALAPRLRRGRARL